MGAGDRTHDASNRRKYPGLTAAHGRHLDLLQFHWWDYGDANYLEALRYLAELRDEGKPSSGSDHFDTEHLHIIVEHGIASCRTRCSIR
jgi:diketogulonate reductase-like aldo/keto reductase